MLRIYNEAAIRDRGGAVYGDDDFEIVACSNCGCQCLYNSEVCELYYDPQDLSKRYLDFDGQETQPCRQCGAEDWIVEELSADDQAAVESGPWSWVLKK